MDELKDILYRTDIYSNLLDSGFDNINEAEAWKLPGLWPIIDTEYFIQGDTLIRITLIERAE